MENKFRALPSVDKLLADARLGGPESVFPRRVIAGLISRRLDDARDAIRKGKAAPSVDAVCDDVLTAAEKLGRPGPRHVINASGVVLHTNLGRAPLSEEAIGAMAAAAAGFSDLEIDTASGKRGSRQVHVERLLCELTGAEAGLVVNNNAAAVLLGLSALAKRREVIVSRGQAVEIGGGFRIPDVMRQSGAKLVEIGTTNCTYVADYEQAITPRTAALLRVHTSNFRVVGFATEVALEDLVTEGKRAGVPVLDDLGSGCLLDTAAYGLSPEPTVLQSIAAGVGLAFFSGDKLVGGPQAGIVVGKKELVDKLKKHPLARATRVDKVRLAGLAMTLLHYLKDEADRKIPVWRMIAASSEELEYRASLWTQALGGLGKVVTGESMVGGGSLPGSTLPTALVSVSPQKVGRRVYNAQRLAALLRAQETPVFARISDEELLLDPRTVLPEEDPAVVRALHRLTSQLRTG
jgi:L-seryl-tRNA(Ser) seleniumtransferase